MHKIVVSLQKFLPLIIVLLISLGAVLPLVGSNFYHMHDDTQPSRIFVMSQALRSGQFPVRWVADLGYGYGYPIFNFYAPLPYYIGAIFHSVGFDSITAAKLMIIIGVLLSGVTMYALGKYCGNRLTGIVAAILYMYAPYHAVNTYIRGAVGELYGYAFLPLLMVGILQIIHAAHRKGIITTGIGLGLILISHNILGLMSLFFVGLTFGVVSILCIFKRIPQYTVLYLLTATLLGIGLSAFFTLPAYMEKQFTNVESITIGGSDYHDHYLYLDQLWDSPWGYAGSGVGRTDAMSFKLGKLHVILAVLSIISMGIYFYTNRSKKKNEAKKVYVEVITISLLVISLYLTLGSSRWVWDSIPWFKYIQFPWRFINYVLLSLSVLTAIAILPFNKYIQRSITIMIVCAIVALNIKYFTPEHIITIYPEEYDSQQSLQTSISKISDEYLPEDFIRPATQSGLIHHGISESSTLTIQKIIHESPTNKEYTILVPGETNIIANIAYFPGWKAYIDNASVEVKSNRGRLEVAVPEGEHDIHFIFTNTPIRLIGNTISLLCLFLLVYVSLFKRRLIYGKET